MNPRHPVFPTWFIPHGGGPCFFMDWTLGPADTWNQMAVWLRGLASTLAAKPRALVVVSAHWEAAPIRINSHPNPPLIYDYSGFPPHTYELQYPAPGSPALAGRIHDLLRENSIEAVLDPEHGFDHGVFVPLLLIYPEAEIPVVQVSLHSSLDPERHLELGRALAPLREEGVLLIGSGFSVHNMERMINPQAHDAEAEEFDRWLRQSCEQMAPARSEALRSWHRAPSAREAHPREEHLLPLLVAAAAAPKGVGETIYRDTVLGAQVSGFRFGDGERN